MNIDWSKAPKGYDFHFQGKAADPYGKFYKATSDRFLSEMDTYILYRDVAELFTLTHRPESVAEWTGEGLPPVGLTCDFMWNYKRERPEYVKARVLFHDGGSAVVRILEGEGKGSLRESRGGDCGAHPVFKLICTPEQIAAEEIQRIRDEIGYQRPQLGPCPVEQMYLLGYRKFEIVEGE